MGQKTLQEPWQLNAHMGFHSTKHSNHSFGLEVIGDWCDWWYYIQGRECRMPIIQFPYSAIPMLALQLRHGRLRQNHTEQRVKQGPLIIDWRLPRVLHIAVSSKCPWTSLTVVSCHTLILWFVSEMDRKKSLCTEFWNTLKYHHDE